MFHDALNVVVKMDLKLRTLKRKAENDPSFWPIYARALEQALGGVKEFEKFNSVFTESYVADAHLEDFRDDCTHVGAQYIHCDLLALMVELEWEQSWGDEVATQIKLRLSEKFLKLIEAAKQRGYQYLLFWK